MSSTTTSASPQEEIYIGFVKEEGFGSREGRKGRVIKDDPKKYPSRDWVGVGGWAGGEAGLWQLREQVIVSTGDGLKEGGGLGRLTRWTGNVEASRRRFPPQSSGLQGSCLASGSRRLLMFHRPNCASNPPLLRSPLTHLAPLLLAPAQKEKDSKKPAAPAPSSPLPVKVPKAPAGKAPVYIGFVKEEGFGNRDGKRGRIVVDGEVFRRSRQNRSYVGTRACPWLDLPGLTLLSHRLFPGPPKLCVFADPRKYGGKEDLGPLRE